MAAVGKAKGVDTILQEVARNLGATEKEVAQKAHAFVNFMKHADRDPTAALEGFSDLDNESIIFFACQDFGRATGGMPVEAQVYEAWFFATTAKRVSVGSIKWQRMIKACIRHFPRVRSVPRIEKKRIGLKVLREALKDPTLKMDFSRIVDLPNGST